MLFSHTNSPQPPAKAGQALYDFQRGAKKLLTPFFCLQEKGDRGISTCKLEEYFKFLLFIPDSHFHKINQK
jgi:hypothetical protein